MMIRRLIVLCIATLAMSMLLTCIGCHNGEDKNLPHDSSLDAKPAPTQGATGPKGVAPPSPTPPR